jgi:hypothetical protein
MRLWTEEEVQIFVASLGAMADAELMATELPFPSNFPLSLNFFIWQTARNEMIDLVKQVANTSGDFDELMYKLDRLTKLTGNKGAIH